MELVSLSETIHFIGVGGAGMSALARILAGQGAVVTGSDLRESAVLESLRSEYGVRAVGHHDAEFVQNADLVVYSAAVKGDNPEYAAARHGGIPLITRAQMLGRRMTQYPKSIAVTGTHGKTTTSGMISSILLAAGVDPTIVIGGDLPAIGGNAKLGKSDFFVAESCEAYGSFLELSPHLAIVTNIEADHLDYYGDLAGVKKAFRDFLERVTGTAIVCGQDPNIAAITANKSKLPRIVRYGFVDNLDYRAENIDHSNGLPTYTLSVHGKAAGTVQLGVPGYHNVANSVAAAAAALELGVDFSAVASGLGDFRGTGRRFEHLGVSASGVLVVDDYAHHPTEIQATLLAARSLYPNRRIVAAFQPHLPSRTRDFLTEFASSFGQADHVVLTDIYLAREKPMEGVTGAGLAALTADDRGSEHVTYVADPKALPERLQRLTQPGDLLLTLGAGDEIRKVAEAFVAAPAQILEESR